jgi:hypothetical protein
VPFHPKEIRFYRYPPPRHENEHYSNDRIFVSVPTLHSFVEERPEQHYSPTISDKLSMSSKSNSVEPCFSIVYSLLSSRPTTPSLEVIDLRILEPFNIGNESERQYCDQGSIQLDPLNVSSKDEI